MTRDYLLRIEGVNLSALLDDTQQLSVIRGGGLAVLRSMSVVERELGLEPVSTGASTGIFRFQADDQAAAEGLRREVEEFLRSHRIEFEAADSRAEKRSIDLGSATFVVDVVPSTDDFVDDREALLAKNRWRQMREPSLALPEVSGSDGVCAFDRVRPARAGLEGPEGKLLSSSAYERWHYGRAQKQAFYEELTGESFPQGFSQDFDRLSADPDQGILHHKMAVLYLDGNRFGSLQNQHCTDLRTQRIFDETLRERRQSLLRDLLRAARDEEAMSDFRESGGQGPIRFETLLWGGDELLWVVPAWRGWDTLARFYEDASSWTAPFPDGDVPLRHAGGLLFCHHNAPIYRIRALAKDLAELAKREPEKNLFAYQVLETFDHTGGDLDGFRTRRSPPGVDHRLLTLDGTRMRAIAEAAQALQPHLPHRQVLRLVRSPSAPDPPPDEPSVSVDSLRSSVPAELRNTFDRLVEDLGGPKSFGLHLTDLWDYL